MKKNSVKNKIPDIIRLKNEGYTNREIGSILELNFQSVKTAMKRHNKISDLSPKEVQDRSSLAGPL